MLGILLLSSAVALATPTLYHQGKLDGAIAWLETRGIDVAPLVRVAEEIGSPVGGPPAVLGGDEEDEEEGGIPEGVVQPLPDAGTGAGTGTGAGPGAGTGTGYPDEVRERLIESGAEKRQGSPPSKDLPAIDPSAPPAAWPAMTEGERAAFLTDHPELLVTYPELLGLHPELAHLVPEPDGGQTTGDGVAEGQPGPAPEVAEVPAPEEETEAGQAGAAPTYPAHEWAPGNSPEVTRQLKESGAEKSWGAPASKDGPPTSEAEWQARRAEWEAQQKAQATSGASGNGRGGFGSTPPTTTTTGTTSTTSSVSAPAIIEAPASGGSGGGSGGFVATEPPETGGVTFSGTTGVASGGGSGGFGSSAGSGSGEESTTEGASKLGSDASKTPAKSTSTYGKSSSSTVAK